MLELAQSRRAACLRRALEPFQGEGQFQGGNRRLKRKGRGYARGDSGGNQSPHQETKFAKIRVGGARL
jgi:hypothetical protein